MSGIIVSMLNRHVEVDVAARTRPRNDVTSYELVLKGMMHCRMQPVVGLDAAAGYFRRALEVNPAFAEAMRGLTIYHLDRWIIDYQPADLAAALDYGRRGTELDPTNAPCLVCLGLAQMAAHGVDEARPAFRRALEINPGDSYVLADAGLHAIYDGRLEEARAFLDRAVRLNPIRPYWFVKYPSPPRFFRRPLCGRGTCHWPRRWWQATNDLHLGKPCSCGRRSGTGAGLGPRPETGMGPQGAFDLLCVLLDHPGEVVSKDAIFAAVPTASPRTSWTG